MEQYTWLQTAAPVTCLLKGNQQNWSGLQAVCSYLSRACCFCQMPGRERGGWNKALCGSGKVNASVKAECELSVEFRTTAWGEAACSKNNKCWLSYIRTGTNETGTVTLTLCLSSYSSTQGVPLGPSRWIFLALQVCTLYSSQSLWQFCIAF